MRGSSAYARRLDTVGPTKPKEVHPRWRITHRASGLVHETRGRSQYAYAAHALAVSEGFASRVVSVGSPWPTFADCLFENLSEIETDIDFVPETDDELSGGKVA